MSDNNFRSRQAALLHGAGPPPARVAQPGELLFEFLHGHDRIRVELRDRGQYGVEGQLFINEEFRYGHRFDARELAIAWADAERRAIEANR